MKPIPNYEVFHELINNYIQINPLCEVSHFPIGLRGNKNAISSFSSELIYRAISKRIKRDECLGIGDVDPFYLNFIHDFNTYYITFAGQQINEFREVSRYHPSVEVERHVDKELKRIDPGGEEIGKGDAFHLKEMMMQIIQEGSAIKLLEDYLGVNPGQTAEYILDQWYMTKGEDDWKALRCAFWRYLMYSGFAQVNSDAWLIKESIPKMDLLPKLVDRFIRMYRLRQGYQSGGLEAKTEESVDQFLNSERIAKSFLKFNEVEVS